MKFECNSGRLWLRVLVLGTGLLLSLVLIQGIVYWRFDPQEVRNAIDRSLAGTGREVKVEGEIRPRLFPSPGLVIEKVSLTDRDGKTPVARAERVDVRVYWWQWLTGDYVVRSLRLEDSSLILARRSDGTSSFNDLFRSAQPTKYRFRLETLKVRDSTLVFSDAARGMNGRFEAIDLDALDLRSDDASLELTSRLFDGYRSIDLTLSTPMVIQDDQVRVDALDLQAQTSSPSYGTTQFSAKGKLRLNFAALQAESEALTFSLQNESPRSSFTLTVPRLLANFDKVEADRAGLAGELDGGGRGRYQFRGALDKLRYANKVFDASRLSGQLDWQNGQHSISLNVASPLCLSQQTLSLNPLTLSARASTPYFPRKQLAVQSSGGGTAWLGKGTLAITVAGKFDDADLKISMQQQGWLNAYRKADISLTRLDLNRYLSESAGNPVALLNSAERVNLNWLDHVNFDAHVSVGEMTMGRFHLDQVAGDVKANPRTLQLTGISADIYKGKLAGSVKLTRDGVIRVESKQTLTNVNITPVLVDLFGFHRLGGRGDSMIEMTAQGNSFQAWRNTLTGDMALSLTEGALTGIDLVAALKNLPAELRDANRRIAVKTAQRTAFSKLSATIRLNNGVARNRNLQLSSQLVNLTGHGKLDLVNGIIDYTMDVRANPQEFERFKDVNLPLKITGPVGSPGYALDFNAMVKGKKTEAERQDALKEQLKKQIGTMLP